MGRDEARFHEELRNLSDTFVGAKNLIELGMNPPSCLQLLRSFEIDIIDT